MRSDWKINRQLQSFIVAVLCIALLLCGCSSEASSVSQAKEGSYVSGGTKSEHLIVGSYDSADTAVLERIDLTEQTLGLLNLKTGKSYTLSYNGATTFDNRYGDGISAAQLEQGSIVDVKFLKDSKKLSALQVSPDSWTYQEVTKYNLQGINSTASIGNRTYELKDDVRVFSEGREGELMDIIKGDVLTVWGTEHTIYSVRVDAGHGYVRLTNDEALLGGWIEVGQAAITQVSDSMMLVVPEGTYDVKMYRGSSEIMQHVTIGRNQEVVLDAGEIKLPEDTNGYLLFQITPNTATLLVDGESEPIGEIVTLPGGVHEIEVSAPGYISVSKRINVGTGLATLSLALEKDTSDLEDNTTDTTDEETNDNSKKPEDEENTATDTVSGNESTVSGNHSGKTVSGNTTDTTTVTTKGSNKVYVDAPADVELYLDGAYVGLSPTSFKKVAGSHTLSLRKEGYVTRSYTIYLYDDGENITYSFTELEKQSEDQGKEETETVSGND